MFSSALPRVSSTHSQAGTSSLLVANTWRAGPRGISHGQNEPVVSSLHATPRFPRPLLPNPQQQPRVPHGQTWQQRSTVPQWLQKPHTTPHQHLWPPPSQTAAAVYQSDSAAGGKWANTSSATRGSRGRGGQPAAARSTSGLRSGERTREMRKQLLDVFPNHAEQVDTILQQNRQIDSVDELCLKVSEIV